MATRKQSLLPLLDIQSAAFAEQIIEQHPYALIGLEHLTDIGERTRHRKRTRKKHGKGYERVSPKARKANRVYSQWSFAQLHALLSYKAVLSGSQAVKVDADYTSKRCPLCGYTADENRPRKGLLFACQQCHYTLHADLVGARNLVMRTLVLRQDWSTTGHLSLAPDASDIADCSCGDVCGHVFSLCDIAQSKRCPTKTNLYL